jgi:hypothetical protein
MDEKRKMFFSEEKNQKTFIRCCRGPILRQIHLKSQKSFASFFRKEDLASSARATPGDRMSQPQGRLV